MNETMAKFIRRGLWYFHCTVLVAFLLIFTVVCDDNSTPNDDHNQPGDKFLLSFIYADASEYKYIFPAYSKEADSGAPWDFKHQGIDLIAAQSGACILAPASGIVQQIQLYLNPGNGVWQVNLHIRCDDSFSYNLMLEPRASSLQEDSLQLAALRISEGAHVEKADTIGTILKLSHDDPITGDATVHFDLWKDGENICPEPYFEPAVLEGLLTLLHAKLPDAELCYP